jgi:phospho-N-acetylmuramoyl-pentapeptide-transferase
LPDYLIAGLAALLVALVSGPLLIPALRRFKFGQFIRTDGPQAHLTKTGTPTMGGIMFFLTLPIGLFFATKLTPESFMAILLAVTLGILGFCDDYLKIKKRQSEGLTAKQKLLGQVILAGCFAIVIFWLRGSQLWIPFLDIKLDIGLWRIPLTMFIVVAAANAVNLTDGLDGLAAGVTFFVALAFLLLCRAWNLGEITWFAGSLAGSCLGFLFFNLHPARVFMGDTGSLALGGAVAALSILTETELLLPLLGIIYVAEVLSDILQVTYFKWTGGKRLFRMAPLHHHFELYGWSESRIDVTFWLITAVCALVFLWILL